MTVALIRDGLRTCAIVGFIELALAGLAVLVFPFLVIIGAAMTLSGVAGSSGRGGSPFAVFICASIAMLTLPLVMTRGLWLATSADADVAGLLEPSHQSTTRQRLRALIIAVPGCTAFALWMAVLARSHTVAAAWTSVALLGPMIRDFFVLSYLAAILAAGHSTLRLLTIGLSRLSLCLAALEILSVVLRLLELATATSEPSPDMPSTMNTYAAPASIVSSIASAGIALTVVVWPFLAIAIAKAVRSRPLPAVDRGTETVEEASRFACTLERKA